MAPKKSTSAVASAEDTFSFSYEVVTILVAFLIKNKVALGENEFKLMRLINGKRGYSAFENLFRGVKKDAKQLLKVMEEHKAENRGDGEGASKGAAKAPAAKGIPKGAGKYVTKGGAEGGKAGKMVFNSNNEEDDDEEIAVESEGVAKSKREIKIKAEDGGEDLRVAKKAKKV